MLLASYLTEAEVAMSGITWLLQLPIQLKRIGKEGRKEREGCDGLSVLVPR